MDAIRFLVKDYNGKTDWMGVLLLLTFAFLMLLVGTMLISSLISSAYQTHESDHIVIQNTERFFVRGQISYEGNCISFTEYGSDKQIEVCGSYSIIK